LTTKEAKHSFPNWTAKHQLVFNAIKALVLSCKCLTVINHGKPGNNRVFITCDASDWQTGTTLSFSETWKTTHPVAFDLMQLKDAEKNYPVHEKELLTIICAPKKWRSNLLGCKFIVYMDHQTLENFNSQRDLSQQQLHWQEYMSQYDLSIMYIPGEDNPVADGLSHICPNTFPDEFVEEDEAQIIWFKPSVNVVLSITTDASILETIKNGYKSDSFCVKVISA
jgi:hypothetical protein